MGKSIATESDATGPETSNVVMNHPRAGYARLGRFGLPSRQTSRGGKFAAAFTDYTLAIRL